MTRDEEHALQHELRLIEALVRKSAEFMHDRSKWEQCTKMNESAVRRLHDLIRQFNDGKL